MFKHLKAVSVLSLILFLAGVFCIIFSINEINTVIAENSEHYEDGIGNPEIKRIIIVGSIPMSYEYEYGDKFDLEIKNINLNQVKVTETDGELYINYEIESKNMDRLFLPALNHITDTKPHVKITIPDELTVTEYNNKSINYYFNIDIMKIMNLRYYPDTKIEIFLDDASNVTIAYNDPITIYTEYEVIPFDGDAEREYPPAEDYPVYQQTPAITTESSD